MPFVIVFCDCVWCLRLSCLAICNDSKETTAESWNHAQPHRALQLLILNIMTLLILHLCTVWHLLCTVFFRKPVGCRHEKQKTSHVQFNVARLRGHAPHSTSPTKCLLPTRRSLIWPACVVVLKFLFATLTKCF